MELGNAGGLSDYVVVKEEQAVRLPEGFPLDMGGKLSLFIL